MNKIKYSLYERIRIPDYDSSTHMQSGDLIIDEEKCNECGICIKVCPGACLVSDGANKMDLMTERIKGGKYGTPRLVVLRSGAKMCVGCYDCGTACPNDAIALKSNFNSRYHFKRLTQTSEMKYPKKY